MNSRLIKSAEGEEEMEFLKVLFGERSLTYEELKAAIEKEGMKLADLSKGGYVDKQKFDNKVDELSNVQGQLTVANDTIKSFQRKDADIETVKQKAADYDKDKRAWEEKTATMQKEFSLREELILAGARNPKAVAAVLDITKAEFKEGKWEGLKELIEEHKKSEDYLYRPVEDASGSKNPPKFTKVNEGKKVPEVTREEIEAIKDSKERTRMIQENIQLFK